MEDPLNPMGSQDPLNNTNPMEDPLFDALERSIENPPGFTDPLIENEDPLMDDLARQLDAVEADIENSPPIPPQPAPGELPGEQEKDETDVSEQEPSIPLLPSTPDTDETSEDSDEEEPETDNLQAPSQQEQSGKRPWAGPMARPPRMPYGDGWRQGGHPPVRRSRPGGRTGTGRSGGLRYCPDSRDLISEEKCYSCEKFRHWPEGTDEEPRECWYDWQAEPSHRDESDNELY